MSALAQVAQARGIRVSGSDPHADPETNPAIRRLRDGGATLYREHRAENLTADVDLVVASAAIAETNPEVGAARELGVRIISRAEFLGELMAAHRGVKVAVAGTHGKTTTTAMLGVLLQHAGLDPTVFVGGEVQQLGGNVRIGGETGPFVAEACEAYDSFLYLKPDIAIVTNVEADHLDHYGTEAQVIESFRRFLSGVSPDGTVVVCGDDDGIQRTLDDLPAPPNVREYGMEARFYSGSRAKNVDLGRVTTFEWHCEVPYTPITLRVPGRHNALNALAAATVGNLLHLPGPVIAAGLAEFTGAERRQETLGEAGSILVLDDYAHHPTEIEATLAALRSACPERRLVAIFQPHLYSRTRDFLPQFADALSKADALVVTDIYAAREAPIPGVRAADIVHQAAQRRPDLPAVFLPDKKELPAMLLAFTRPNDLTVFLGAGDIRAQGEAFLRLLREKERAG